MNKGVEILIARMKSNPEDFDYDGRFSTYGAIFAEMANNQSPHGGGMLYYLAEEDRTALLEAWNEHMRQDFTNNVMKTLVEDPPQLVERKQLSKSIIAPSSMINQAQQMVANQQAAYNSPYQNQASWGGAIGIADSTFK